MRDGKGFVVLDAAHEADVRRWTELWKRWPDREVFAHPAYVRLYCDGERSRAMCAVLETADGCVMYPFIVRDLTTEPFWNGSRGQAYDITTPYGYGGPFTWGATDAAALAVPFWRGFERWCSETGVVSEFLRFTLFSDDVLPFPGTQEPRLDNVVRRLDVDPEAMWMEFEAKVRKNVNRARRSGVEVAVDPTGERLDDFLRIYSSTMERRSASSHYYFPRSYFERIHDELPGQFVYLHALHEGSVVSTELVLVSSGSIYSFLGGTDRDAFKLRANDLLKYEIIRWGVQQGKRRFILGGGYEPGDGIYRYKLSFAPDGALPFYVGTRVHDSVLYQQLVGRQRRLAEAQGREWTTTSSYFPRYRA